MQTDKVDRVPAKKLRNGQRKLYLLLNLSTRSMSLIAAFAAVEISCQRRTVLRCGGIFLE